MLDPVSVHMQVLLLVTMPGRQFRIHIVESVADLSSIPEFLLGDLLREH